MNALLGLLLLLSMVSVVGAFVFLVLSIPRIQWLTARATEEVHRNEFGQLRTTLMGLARGGQVDVNLPRFELLFSVLTLLMRHPRQYGIAVNAILGSQADTKTRQAPMDPVEAAIWRDVVLRFDRLCRDYSWVYRVMASLIDRTEDGKRGPLWVQGAITRSRPYQKRVGPVRRAEDVLRNYPLSAAA